MAEVTAFRNNALPYPIYGCPYTVAFPILDADGDLVTGAAGLDSEVSKNGDGFADCTNEATEIATSSGIYYLTLTGTEMTADVVSIIVKTSTSGAKTTTIVLYPRKLVELATGTAQGGAAGYITLAASTVLFDNQYSGCICFGTLDSTEEVRILGACTASNQQCAVTPEWNTVPDDSDTYKIYLPEGMRFPTSNLKAISDDTTAPDNLELMYDGTGYAGGTAKLDVNLVSILGTALTETAGQISAAFKKFFNVAAPTGTINSIPDAVAGANGGLPTTNGTKINQTVDLTAGQSIACSDKTGFSLSEGQAMTGTKVVIDEDAGTVKVYDSGDNLLNTYTKTSIGNVHTMTRT